MPAPIFRLPATGVDPKVTTKQLLENNVNAVLSALYGEIATIATGLNPRGGWDASSGAFPSGSKKGDYWIVSDAGTMDEQGFIVGDWLVALANNASTSTYAENWFRADYSTVTPKEYATIADLALADDAIDGMTKAVVRGFNGEREYFTYVAGGTLPTSDLVVDGVGGQWVSKRTVYADFAELDGDVRSFYDGTALNVIAGDAYRVVSIDQDITLSGGLGVNLVPDEPTLFEDADTGEDAPLTIRKSLANFTNAFYDKMHSSKSGQAPNIVCYGDSNTRYYQGDTSTTGPFSRSYGAWLDLLSTVRAHLFSAEITINGYPGQTASYGDTNFASNVPSNADYVVVGFGTNDVKQAAPDLDAYLSSITSILRKSLAQGTQPILLGIPYFTANYGDDGVLSTQRIKVWNAHLINLANEAGVPFIDTYSLTYEFSFAYLNEATTRRHYSVNATKVIAERIADVLDHLMPSAQVAGFSQVDDFSDLTFIKKMSGSVVREQYTIGGKQLDVLKVPAGGSITIGGNGRGCIAFYPRANATVGLVAKINGGTTAQSETISITTSIDAGEFYPVLRQGLNYNNTGSGTEVTLTATTGDFFLRGVAFEDGLILPVNQYTSGVVEVDAADVPSRGVLGRTYFLTDLRRPAYYTSVGWVSADGVFIIGTTTQRDAVSSGGVSVGYKFYNTTTSAIEKWNGSAWV